MQIFERECGTTKRGWRSTQSGLELERTGTAYIASTLSRGGLCCAKTKLGVQNQGYPRVTQTIVEAISGECQCPGEGS